jgi:hypothetical protein
MYTSGSCGAGFRTFYPGARLVYQLSLGDAAPLGGSLTLTTCGATANNTALYVGTGCPRWNDVFGCLVGSDDAGGGACAGNPLASTVTLAAAQRAYYVQLGGVGGRAVTAGLRWAYAPPSGTPSRTAAPASKSRSAGPTRSRRAAQTRSRKPK